jgi:hypothetical protein
LRIWNGVGGKQVRCRKTLEVEAQKRVPSFSSTAAVAAATPPSIWEAENGKKARSDQKRDYQTAFSDY